MSIMISSSLPRSSPAEFRTLSPASVLAARTRRYFLSGSVFSILLCIEMLLILLEPCTFDAYRASRARRCCSLLSIGRRGLCAVAHLFVNLYYSDEGAENSSRDQKVLHDRCADQLGML